MEPFNIIRKVYYDDTDGGGVVYHANYVKYMDHCRSEFLASHGFELQVMAKEDGIVFAVAEIAIKYLLPARLSDTLQINAQLEKARGSSLYFVQDIYRMPEGNGEESVHLTQSHVKVVCLDAEAFKPCPIPEYIRERISCSVT